MFKDLRKLLFPLNQNGGWLWDRWQTLVWISVFSWGMSLLATSLVQSLIAAIGGLFLIAGIHWGLHEDAAKKFLTVNKVFLAPWITGALLCLFIAITLVGGFTAAWIQASCLLWTPLSAAIAAAPNFIKATHEGPNLRIPDVKVRRSLIHLLLFNLLISCWVQFYFVVQGWLAEYPSIEAQDLSRSAFVVKWSPGESLESRGNLILQQAAALLEAELANRPWAQVERWLYDLGRNPIQFQQQVMARMTALEENSFWRLQTEFLAGEYNLELAARWEGPSLDGKGFYLKQNCQIVRSPVPQLRTTPTGNPTPTDVAEVRCTPVIGPTNNDPAA